MVRHEFSDAMISGVIGIERIEDVLEFPDSQPFRGSSGDSCSREEDGIGAAARRWWNRAGRNTLGDFNSLRRRCRHGNASPRTLTLLENKLLGKKVP